MPKSHFSNKDFSTVYHEWNLSLIISNKSYEFWCNYKNWFQLLLENAILMIIVLFFSRVVMRINDCSFSYISVTNCIVRQIFFQVKLEGKEMKIMCWKDNKTVKYSNVLKHKQKNLIALVLFVVCHSDVLYNRMVDIWKN